MSAELRRSYQLIYLIVFLLLSACKVEETIDLNADGSGTYRAKVSVTKDLGEALDQVKQEAGQHGLRVLEEGQTADEKFVVVGRDFSKVSDLGDKDDTYSLVVTREGWFRRSYRFDAILRQNVAASGFERILHVHMPGSVDRSSNGQVSSHTVEWPCSHGGQLDIVASGFATPELSSLPASLSTTIDRALSQDTLVFVKDGALWVAAQDGASPHPVGPTGVGSLSTSSTGAITYDRFNSGGDTGTQDLNVYLLDGPEGKPRKLTDDNQSILPKISPDGRSIVYQKFVWDGRVGMNGQGGRGLWLYDVTTGHERELVGADPRANSGAPFGLQKWRLDDVIWAVDGQSLIMTRQYQTDGGGLYLVDYIVSVADGHTEPFDKYKPDDSFRAPRLALDAGHVLAVSWHGSENGLIEEDVATRQARMIVPGATAGFVVLSPDGGTIAYTTPTPKGSDLWTVRRDGSELHKLTERPLVDGIFRPEWAPDSHSLVVTVWSDNSSLAKNMKIVQIDAQSGRQEILVSGARSGSLLREPRFSPGWLWLISSALFLAAAMMATALLLWLRRRRRGLGSRRVQRVAPAVITPPRYCRACGQALPAVGAFCVKCGTKLD